MIDQTITHYKILQKIGEGGMGVVYKALDTKLDRIVALKFLPSSLLTGDEDRRRFAHEAQAAAALSHPNIATVFEIDENADTTFIALEYIDGVTLAEKVRQGPLKLEEALGLAIQICDGIQVAHEQGIVHRDIKCQNIMVTPKGQVKILDFGLAKLRGASVVTRMGTTVGTVGYMSPEQLRGEAVDQRTDIWAIGIVLYEMISGRRPFHGDYEEAVAYQIIHQQPEPLTTIRTGVPIELDRIVGKALAKDPKERYQRVEELAIDFRTSQKTLAAQKESGTSARIKTVHPPKRTTIWVASLAAFLTVIAIIGIFVIHPFSPPVSGLSIAVLPLATHSELQNDVLFVDGMTESITANLGKLPGLLVKSHSSVAQFIGKALNIEDVAKKLQVRYVLAGDVFQSGDRLRIAVNLIDASTGFQTWTGKFDALKRMPDVFAVQDSIAERIIAEMSTSLPQARVGHRASIPTANMEAYDFYLRGKNLANRENRADIDSAIAALKQAISLDPTFSAAYAQLARAYNVKATLIAAGEKQWEVLASAALDKALALDSSLAEAHLVRGLMLWTQSNGFPHEETIKEFRRAVLLDPTMDEAHHQLGTVYIHLGMWEKCLAELNQALSLNPANTMARFRIGVLHSYRQEYGEALRQVEAIPKEFNPALLGYHVSWSLFHLDRRREAQVKLTEYLKAAAHDEGGILSAMQALLFASTGDTLQANQKIDLAIQTSQGYKHFHHTAFIIGCCHALMHHQHEAVEWLRRAADDGFPCYPVYDQEPILKNLKQNSEFQSFMEDLRRRWEHFKEMV